MRWISAVLSACFCLAAPLCPAADISFHTQAKLVLSADTVRPGDTVLAGVDLKMEPGWHTYWKNPGEAGMATKIEWQFPPGVTAGEIEWPLPEKLPPPEVTTYGYSHEVMLIVPLTLAADLKPGPLDLQARLTWLECKTECIPGTAVVAATLNVGTQTRPSANNAAIKAWGKKVPFTMHGSASDYAWWEGAAKDDTRTLVIAHLTANAANPVKFDYVKYNSVDFYPDANEHYEIEGPTTVLSNFASDFRLSKAVKKFDGGWPQKISGVLVLQRGDWRGGYEVKLPVGDGPPNSVGEAAGSAPESSESQSSSPGPSLWLMLVYAFIGGLILNIMPCVLPVIALKILGFVGEARSDPRRVRQLGMVYALGVLVSFLALAGVIVALKAAGQHVSWGIQFKSPVFVVSLATLVTLVALNLFGVFEVALSARALDAAGGLASRQGAAGAFFNGFLATALATPCTAPYLAYALGFAFLQNTAVIISIFLTVGAGLAFPYVLLSWNPAWLKLLPKPGPWMEKFKIAMGFPMLATVVWLYSIAASSYGKNVLWLGVFLVIVALAAWVFGEFFQRGRSHFRFAGLLASLLLLAGGYFYVLEKELEWRQAAPAMATAGSLKESPNGIDWQPWSPAAVAQARAAGHPVLVDFTADWCLTCQVNKKIAIEVPSVRKKLKEIKAVALVGDYTHFPDSITTELNRFNRAGVPLVLVYPKNPSTPPIILPQVLTPGIVLNALNQSGG